MQLCPLDNTYLLTVFISNNIMNNSKYTFITHNYNKNTIVSLTNFNDAK